MNSMECFNETSLPGEEAFYNSLENKPVTKKEYQHAKSVWAGLNCVSMRDYHDHYLKTDVLLLTDIFENFRVMAKETYKLDPVHYYSLPGLSWDAMLKYTKVELELITDLDIYQMVEKGMRGGISQISHRFAESNHPSMESYNPSRPIKTLTYQDANALYSWPMLGYLPWKNFLFGPDNIDFLNVPEDNPIGYILEVSIEYPEELHDAHNDLPLAPEHLHITDDMLSPFQRENFPSRGSVKKLVPNLNDKE